jgi:hypothetical protein
VGPKFGQLTLSVSTVHLSSGLYYYIIFYIITKTFESIPSAAEARALSLYFVKANEINEQPVDL